MHFGEAIDDARLTALLRPGDGIDTVLTADAYGAGEADELLGRALAGVDRDAYCLVGAVGHDFYEGEREGSKGFPRFTDPRLRGPDGYAAYLRMATERSLQRLGVDRFDLLLLHNPDRIGYTSQAVWEGMAAAARGGADPAAGRRPGAGQRLHARRHRLPGALRRADRLGDGHPQPARAVARRARAPGAQRYDIDVITRVVDYGGLFWDDVRPGHAFAPRDHRAFRPEGWVESGSERLERMRPIAERHGLTALQLACQWNLAHLPVRCTVPTLIEEPAAEKPIEAKRAELAAVPRELAALRRRAGRDPRDRRQHGLHGAEGRLAAVRGRAAARPLAADERAA